MKSAENSTSPLLEVDGVGEIDDLAVVGIGDGERKVDAAGDALVCAGVAEGFAGEDVGAGGNFHAEDAGVAEGGR